MDANVEIKDLDFLKLRLISVLPAPPHTPSMVKPAHWKLPQLSQSGLLKTERQHQGLSRADINTHDLYNRTWVCFYFSVLAVLLFNFS